jgi:rSAM/selenodomain-associated transferase 2
MNKRSASISVIIPVLYEAERINQIIEHVCGLKKNIIVEIIVSDGDACGSTIKAVAGEKVIRVLSEKGRGRQMNKGATAATGDVLLFLHADTLLPTDAFEKIIAVMKTGCYAGGAFDLGIASDKASYRIIECIASWRSRLTRIPYGDQAIFVRKDVFTGLGGFREFPIMEDVELMRSIKRSGHQIFIITTKVRTSPRRWEEEGIICCTVRNWVLVTLYLLGVRPDALARFYK